MWEIYANWAILTNFAIWGKIVIGSINENTAIHKRILSLIERNMKSPNNPHRDTRIKWHIR